MPRKRGFEHFIRDFLYRIKGKKYYPNLYIRQRSIINSLRYNLKRAGYKMKTRRSMKDKHYPMFAIFIFRGNRQFMGYIDVLFKRIGMLD